MEQDKRPKKKSKEGKSEKIDERKLIYSLPENIRKQSKCAVINCTSRSTEEWSKGLSPFFLGPVPMYNNLIAKNVENAWQFSKVYEEHLEEGTDDPSDKWIHWAKEGFANPKPIRFPMGPGAKPVYSYWNGRKLKYVDARIEIYAPIYANLVSQSAAFQKLKQIYDEHNGNICLWDFDGYDHFKFGMTLEDALYEEKKKMGHGFVLMMLLKGTKFWENPKQDRLANVDRYVPPVVQ